MTQCQSEHFPSHRSKPSPTWISEHLFGLCNVNELLLCRLLVLRVLEVIGVPLLSQLPVGLYDLPLLCRPAEAILGKAS